MANCSSVGGDGSFFQNLDLMSVSEVGQLKLLTCDFVIFMFVSRSLLFLFCVYFPLHVTFKV